MFHEGLLAEKRTQIGNEIQAIMAELHQTANLSQQELIQKADDELQQKKTQAAGSDTLTALDAMRIQLDNIKQRYLKQMIVVETPDINVTTANRTTLCMPARLENEADVDRYVADMKKKLMQMLDGHDILHII